MMQCVNAELGVKKFRHKKSRKWNRCATTPDVKVQFTLERQKHYC